MMVSWYGLTCNQDSVAYAVAVNNGTLRVSRFTSIKREREREGEVVYEVVFLFTSSFDSHRCLVDRTSQKHVRMTRFKLRKSL